MGRRAIYKIAWRRQSASTCLWHREMMWLGDMSPWRAWTWQQSGSCWLGAIIPSAPPTERNAALNPKYGFVETFDCILFTGTTESNIAARKAMHWSRGEKRKQRTRSRHSWPTVPVKTRKLGGPSTDFLRRYGLDENSHPMDWFTAFLPLSSKNNKEDPAIANVKGDRRSKFAVSN